MFLELATRLACFSASTKEQRQADSRLCLCLPGGWIFSVLSCCGLLVCYSARIGFLDPVPMCVCEGGCPCTDNQSSDASWCRDPTPSLGSPPGVSGGVPGEGAQFTLDINTCPSDGPATSWMSLRPPPTQGHNPGCHLHFWTLGFKPEVPLPWILLISKATNKT